MADEIVVIEQKKGHSWTRNETLLLIQTYKEHEKMFKDVKFKKKSVWERIRARMVEVIPDFDGSVSQVEGKWKGLTAAFRKCCDHNSISGNSRKECPFYNEIAELYGYRPNVRPYATTSSSEGSSLRGREEPSQHEQVPLEESSDENEESAEQPQPEAPKKRKVEYGNKRQRKRGASDEYLQCLKAFQKERAEAQQQREERATQQHKEKMALLGGILEVLKDMKEP